MPNITISAPSISINAASPGPTWKFSASTTEADPGAGYVRFNSGTFSAITAAYFDNTSQGGGDLEAWLDAMDDSTATVKGELHVMDSEAPQDNFFIADFSGTVTNATGYRKLSNLSVTASNGSFTAEGLLTVVFIPSADAADTSSMTQKQQRDGEAYNPTITRVAVDTGTNLYRHVPSIAVKSSSQILAAYLFNSSSASESAAGQRAGFRRSSDDGATWSALVEELNSSSTCTPPLDPAADSNIQGEVFVEYDSTNDREYAVVAHRSGTNEASFFATRDASSASATTNKWTAFRMRWNSTTNEPSFSSSDISGAPDSGYKLTYTIDNTEYTAFPGKPVVATDGRLVVPMLYVTTFGAKHRAGFLIRSADLTTWSNGGVVPQGTLADADAWEFVLWQLDDLSWRGQCRDLSGSDTDNHAVTQSSDLLGWAAFSPNG